jgi:hypothetical protein
MDGLDLFDRDSIKQEYNSNYDYVKANADCTIADLHKFENSITTITHKEFIATVRKGII